MSEMAVFWVVALMMEAARTSETLVNFYQTTRCYNPEDSHLRTHRRENLKSYKMSEDDVIVAGGLMIWEWLYKQDKNRRRYWVHPFFPDRDVKNTLEY
jgi:hypothetical protein